MMGVVPLGELAAELVEDQPHQRPGARDVGGRHHQVERHRALGAEQIGDAPVGGLRHACHDGIAVEPEQRHGGRGHARALVVGLVEELACRGRHRLGIALRPQVIGGEHHPHGPADGAGGIGEKGSDAGERFLLLGVEDVQDGAGEQRVRALLPVVAPGPRPFRVDQDVGDVVNVPHLVESPARLQQRVEAGGDRTGGFATGVEAQSGAAPSDSPAYDPGIKSGTKQVGPWTIYAFTYDTGFHCTAERQVPRGAGRGRTLRFALIRSRRSSWLGIGGKDWELEPNATYPVELIAPPILRGERSAVARSREVAWIELGPIWEPPLQSVVTAPTIEVKTAQATFKLPLDEFDRALAELDTCLNALKRARPACDCSGTVRP
jgi:hypothetical protein